MKSPLRYMGGKSMIAGKIVDLFPKHVCYCEVFGGGASVMLAKQASTVEVYNDTLDDAVNFFRVVADESLCTQLIELCDNTPYSRTVFNDLQKSTPDTPVKRAHKLLCLSRMAFATDFMVRNASFGYSIRRNQAEPFRNTVRNIRAVRDRLQGVIIENLDWRDCLNRYDSVDTLFYLDPPYIPDTRKVTSYPNEMSKQDHVELLETIKGVKGMVMLSGYGSTLYNDMLSEWYTQSWDTHSLTGNNKNRDSQRTEYVWLNFNPSDQLELF